MDIQHSIQPEKQVVIFTLTFEPADYKKDFDKELHEISTKREWRGFRAGKAKPMIRKKYGQAILASVIEKIAQKELEQMIEDLKIPTFGAAMLKDPEAIRLNSPSIELSFVMGHKVQLSNDKDYGLDQLTHSETDFANDAESKEKIWEDEVQGHYEYKQEKIPFSAEALKNKTAHYSLEITWNDLTPAQEGEAEGPKEKREYVYVASRDLLTEKGIEALEGKEIGHAFDGKKSELFDVDKLTEALLYRQNPEVPEGIHITLTDSTLRVRPEMNAEFFTKILQGQNAETEDEAKNLLFEQKLKTYPEDDKNAYRHEAYLHIIEQEKLKIDENYLFFLYSRIRESHKEKNQPLNESISQIEEQFLIENVKEALLHIHQIAEPTDEEVKAKIKAHVEKMLGDMPASPMSEEDEKLSDEEKEKKRAEDKEKMVSLYEGILYEQSKDQMAHELRVENLFATLEEKNKPSIQTFSTYKDYLSHREEKYKARQAHHTERNKEVADALYSRPTEA